MKAQCAAKETWNEVYVKNGKKWANYGRYLTRMERLT